MADELAKRGRPVQLVLTDLYPNQKSFAWTEQQGGGRVRGRLAPVDAAQVPPDLPGVRTLFNGFHHLPPTVARQVLADAVNKNQPIAVFEVVSRELPVLLSLLMLPVLVTLSLPLWRPFRWQWLPFTWLLPVMQLFVLWDGVVSWLRIYSVPELRDLIATIETPPGWTWEVGTRRLGPLPMRGTYLIGYPARPG
jgi:hypothetical protein